MRVTEIDASHSDNVCKFGAGIHCRIAQRRTEHPLHMHACMLALEFACTNSCVGYYYWIIFASAAPSSRRSKASNVIHHLVSYSLTVFTVSVFFFFFFAPTQFNLHTTPYYITSPVFLRGDCVTLSIVQNLDVYTTDRWRCFCAFSGEPSKSKRNRLL